ncbi:hypothetical protein OS493_003244 [Desmophyllum pertusum]|uniref:Homeobox domain-containing protein n=1 Tax=Desmophyllum pertusum TaxID=174260 RepID=A0A9X0CII6_9CNID|nr:hypothetical protein OS493_003244 [Desmophyllum pertusum]
MNAEQPSAGFSISNLLGFDRRSEPSDNNGQQNLSEKTDREGTNSKNTPKKSDKERPSKRAKKNTGEDSEKRYRATFDKSQIYQMERVFLLNHYPDVAARSEMSSSTGLSEAQVQKSQVAQTTAKTPSRCTDDLRFGIPESFGALCGGFEPYTLFPYEYYNTDFWTCARQQVAALHFASLPSDSIPQVPSPQGSYSPKSTDSTASGSDEVKAVADGENLEIRNDSSLLSLRLKAKEHIASMELES